MRKKAFIFLTFFFTLESFAQLANNNLVVISKTGKKFTLYVNEEKVNNSPEANVKAFNINEGWCKLKTEFENGPVISDSIKIKAIPKNNNKDITYSVDETKKKFEFVSITDLSAPKTPKVPEPPYTGPVMDNTIYGNIYKTINDKPHFFFNYNDSTKKCMVELNDKDIQFVLKLIGNTNDIQNRINYVEYTVNRNCYTVQRVSQILATLEIELDKLKYCKRAYPHLTDKNNAPQMKSIFKFKSVGDDFDIFIKELANKEHQIGLNCKEGMNEPQLQDILARVKKGQYEPDRLKIAKEQLVNNCYTTAQVEKMLQLFGHDREKVELAKYAYWVTVDKDNYKILVDNFQFSENKTEFLKFLEK